jgi:hypothetical protein
MISFLDALHQKFYSDMPREQFDAEVRVHQPMLPTGHVLDELLQIEGIGNMIVQGSFDGLSPADQNRAVDAIVSTVWWNKFAVPLATLLAITLGVSLAVYGLVRAIGWVIGGLVFGKWSRPDWLRSRGRGTRGPWICQHLRLHVLCKNAPTR